LPQEVQSITLFPISSTAATHDDDDDNQLRATTLQKQQLLHLFCMYAVFFFFPAFFPFFQTSFCERPGVAAADIHSQLYGKHLQSV
jgi:hypothetical protein